MLVQRNIFVVLGAALYLSAVAFGDDELVVLKGIIGREINFEMETPIDAARCMVTSNTGVKFSLFPAGEEIPPGIDQSFMDTFKRTCGMRILSPTIDHEGIWIIEAYTQSNVVDPETIRHFDLQLLNSDYESEPQTETVRIVDVFPSRTISIFPGYSVTLRMLNHYENLTSCIATSPDGQEFDVLNTIDNASDDIRPFYQCGVTVRVTKNHTGSWRLDATIQKDKNERFKYYGTFYVQVQDSSAIHTEPTVTYVQRGAPASFRVGPSNAVSCQLRSPTGQRSPIQSGSCQMDIPIVTDAHEGFWTAIYSLNGKVNVVEQTTQIVAYDDHPLNATVTTTDNGEVNLLCTVRAYSISFCQFVNPEGRVLNIFEGIGDDEYRYHGNGIQSSSMLTKRSHQCGITILVPKMSDYGAWKCILSTDSGLTGSLLRVPTPELDRDEDVVALYNPETVYVVKGNSFTVKCSANAVLKYCWMRSPNGTAYSVSSTGISPTTLRYEGMGLSMGECGAVIPAADITDEGEWNCGMGVSSAGEEIRTVVRVIVTDSLLLPNVKNVTVSPLSKILSCSLIFGYEQSIDYCRWIKPSGSGIELSTNPNVHERQYSTWNTYDTCYLEIEYVKKFSEPGEWTCVAGLVGSPVEVSATIQVSEDVTRFYRSSYSSWCFGIGLGMASVIIAVCLISMVRTKLQFRKQVNLDLPPQYEKNRMGFPPAMTQCTPPRFQ